MKVSFHKWGSRGSEASAWWSISSFTPNKVAKQSHVQNSHQHGDLYSFCWGTKKKKNALHTMKSSVFIVSSHRSVHPSEEDNRNFLVVAFIISVEGSFTKTVVILLLLSSSSLRLFHHIFAQAKKHRVFWKEQISILPLLACTLLCFCENI